MSLRNRNQNTNYSNKNNYYSSPKLIELENEQSERLIENEFHTSSTPNLQGHPNKLHNTTMTSHMLITKENSYMEALNNFLQSLLNNISSFWSLLNINCANDSKKNISTNNSSPSLTLYQEEKLAQFKSFVTKAYDSNNEYHEKELTKYWKILSNGEELTNRKSAQWKKLGFQGIDPASDFRGAGLFGLQNLLYFAMKYPSSFHSIFRADRRKEGQESYPFSIAALNITMMLFEFIGWGIKSSKKDPLAKRNFLSLLFKRDRPFADLIKFDLSPVNHQKNNINDINDDEDEGDYSDEDNLNDLIGDLSWTSKKSNSKTNNAITIIDEAYNDNNNVKNEIEEKKEKKISKEDDHHAKNEIYFGDEEVAGEYEEELNQSLNIFSEVYCITFHIMEEEWYARENVSYFDFPLVLEATSDKLSSLLSRFTSIADVYNYSSSFA